MLHIKTLNIKTWKLLPIKTLLKNDYSVKKIITLVFNLVSTFLKVLSIYRTNVFVFNSNFH